MHRTPSPNVAQQRGYRGFETPGLSGIESRRSPDEFRPTNLLFASSSRQALLLPQARTFNAVAGHITSDFLQYYVEVDGES